MDKTPKMDFQPNTQETFPATAQFMKNLRCLFLLFRLSLRPWICYHSVIPLMHKVRPAVRRSKQALTPFPFPAGGGPSWPRSRVNAASRRLSSKIALPLEHQQYHFHQHLGLFAQPLRICLHGLFASCRPASLLGGRPACGSMPCLAQTPRKARAFRMM